LSVVVPLNALFPAFGDKPLLLSSSVLRCLETDYASLTFPRNNAWKWRDYGSFLGVKTLAQESAHSPFWGVQRGGTPLGGGFQGGVPLGKYR
jgi:hypothetical protein